MLELPIRPITVSEFERMADVGIISADERVELLDGMLVEMPPIGLPHEIAHTLIVEYLVGRLGSEYAVAGQVSLPMGPQSEPNPDVVVFPRAFVRAKSKADIRSADIIAIIEISHSSLRRDTIAKQRIYAREGVAEYLVVDIIGRRLLRYRDPSGDNYGTVDEFNAADRFTLAAVPQIALDVQAFLPPT
jgi:Uma2 family endonuclease